MTILIRDILAVLPDGVKVSSIYIKDGVITAIDDAPPEFKADKTIPGSGRLLIPGLVNAHTHVYMTLFRNCADDLTFDDWMYGRILPLEDALTPEDCYWGTLLGIMEMLSTGTTAFSTMDFFMDATAGAIKEAGIRAVLARGLVGGRDNPEGGRMRLNQAFDALSKWKDIETIDFMLGPHAPNTCDDSFQKEVAAVAERLGLRIHTHISESRSEVETIRATYGCTPPELMDRCGLLTDRTVAAHCVHVTDGDIELFAKRGVSVVTNPVSNLKLVNGVAPVPKMLKAGLNVALGTDGASSNNALNMFREMGFLSLLHKGMTGDPQMIAAPEALNMATKNGARALGFKDVGEIRVGFKADLAILDLDRPNLQPLNDPVAALAYSANGSEIETVLVGGRILYERGSFTTIDKEKVLFEVDKICERIGTR